jgi:hypothetical protein
MLLDEIHTLTFAPFWECLSNPDYEVSSLAVQKFQHEISERLNPVVKTGSRLSDAQRLKFNQFDRPVEEMLVKASKPAEEQIVVSLFRQSF